MYVTDNINNLSNLCHIICSAEFQPPKGAPIVGALFDRPPRKLLFPQDPNRITPTTKPIPGKMITPVPLWQPLGKPETELGELSPEAPYQSQPGAAVFQPYKKTPAC